MLVRREPKVELPGGHGKQEAGNGAGSGAPPAELEGDSRAPVESPGDEPSGPMFGGGSGERKVGESF